MNDSDMNYTIQTWYDMNYRYDMTWYDVHIWWMIESDRWMNIMWYLNLYDSMEMHNVWYMNHYEWKCWLHYMMKDMWSLWFWESDVWYMFNESYELCYRTWICTWWLYTVKKHVSKWICSLCMNCITYDIKGCQLFILAIAIMT